MGETPDAMTRFPAGTANTEIQIQRDVRIPTGEPGVTLSADVYLPLVDEPSPALLTVSPYRKDASIGIAYDPSLRWFAAHGYAAVLVDLLGTGSSDGRPRPPVDPAEVDDGLAALDWTAAQPWCDGSIGMWGQSYGSMTAMRTATRNPERLRAIVAIMGPIDPELDSIHPNGTRGGQCPFPRSAGSHSSTSSSRRSRTTTRRSSSVGGASGSTTPTPGSSISSATDRSIPRGGNA